jgi:hypothetical protein
MYAANYDQYKRDMLGAGKILLQLVGSGIVVLVDLAAGLVGGHVALVPRPSPRLKLKLGPKSPPMSPPSHPMSRSPPLL